MLRPDFRIKPVSGNKAKKSGRTKGDNFEKHIDKALGFIYSLAFKHKKEVAENKRITETIEMLKKIKTF